VEIATLPITDVETDWNSTLVLLEQANQFREVTLDSLKNSKDDDYHPHYTTQNEWSIIKYAMEVLWQFWYWTLWMSKAILLLGNMFSLSTMT
jgi:hypothetical protein